MDTILAFLRAPAIHIAIAHDAFVFDLSWLGVAIVVFALLGWRYLRR